MYFTAYVVGYFEIKPIAGIKLAKHYVCAILVFSYHHDLVKVLI